MTGILRASAAGDRRFAPGDIRNCLTALANEEKLLTELFQYRFQSGKG